MADLGSSVKWNAIGLVGRQLILIVSAVVLARIVGPTAYGVITQASVYITFTNLLLDQGLSSALVSKATLSRATIRSVVTVNLAIALLIGIVTLPLAAPLADFLRTEELEPVLIVLGMFLVVKGAAIVPRVLLTRNLRFRPIAAAEVGSSSLGAIVAVVVALMGGSYWALVVQFLVTDVVALVLFYIAARPPAPGFSRSALQGVLGFGVRVFAGNFLAFLSRNVDTIMVSRVGGTTAAGQYGLAYKILMMPLQLVGQVVTRVLFPAIARARDDPQRVRRLVRKSAADIAVLAFPAMALVGLTADRWVTGVLGSEWAPAVILIQVLAVTGARQAVTTLNAPILLGMDRSDLHLRFNMVAAVVQIAGIFAGVPWGALGIAIGYTAAGFLMMPVIYYMQREAAGIAVREQLAPLLPPLHGTLWLMLAGWGAGTLAQNLFWMWQLLLSSVAGLVAYAAILALFHRPFLRESLGDFLSTVRKRR